MGDITKLINRARAGAIGRRTFMKGAAAAGIATATASTIWTGTAKAATPKRGGHLRVGTDGGATIDTFNPMQAIGTDHVTNSILSCYDTLTEIAPSGSPVPSLVESWDTSKDGKTAEKKAGDNGDALFRRQTGRFELRGTESRR